MKPERAFRKFTPAHILFYLILTLWALTTVFPFFWVVVNSFKDKSLIQTDAFSLQFEATLENYHKAFTRPPQSVWMVYANSLFISGLVTAGVILLAGMASFALARYRFPGRRALWILVVACLMFPVFSTILPVYEMMAGLGLVNTPWSVILPQIAGNLSFAILLLSGYLQGIPLDLEEAAFLEGCGVRQVLFKIVLPVCRPALATVGIFSFLWSYNDLFTQLFFLRNPERWTITIFLNEVGSQFGTDYGMMCAVVTLIFVPVLLVYLLLQKNIVRGLTAGAIKG